MFKIFLLDAGHGGMIDGVYQTEGKQSPWPAPKVYEGEFTRAIVRRLMEWAPLFGIRCIDMVASEHDVPLQERVMGANAIARTRNVNDLVYVSIHANAGGGRGIEVFTSPGFTRADAMATVFLQKLNHVFPDVRMRTDMSDGDPDKEAGFYVLKHTAMPAILTENFFMDNRDEVENILLSEGGRDKIAMAHLAAMVEIDREVG
jgi:N-acetylmuramoyl-L-alanine amidase